MKSTQLAILFALCVSATAQNIGSTGPFAGPSILTNGVGGVGRRAGQDVDLQFFANATGIYDTGIQPFAIREGALVQPEGQYGVEAGIGAYGVHNFRRSRFGVDYNGNFRHYPKVPSYDGTNQSLGLEYSTQVSRRWVLDMRQSAGTQNFGTALGSDLSAIPGGADANLLLFDNRTNFLQSTFNARYLLGRRTVVSAGGSYYTVHRQARALVGVNGYTLNGSIQRQMTRKLILGAQYQHMHYDYPRAFGESDINYYVGDAIYEFGRNWLLSVGGGAFTAETQGVQNTTLEPALAVLLGVGSVQTAFYKKSVLPVALASVTKTFRKSAFTAGYNTSVTPGNGVYLTSRQRGFVGSYSYNGISRFGISLSAASIELQTIGQTLQNYTQYNGTLSLSYRLGKGVNLNTSYFRRYQDIQNNAFQRNSSRISLGIYFSPSDIPISFH